MKQTAHTHTENERHAMTIQQSIEKHLLAGLGIYDIAILLEAQPCHIRQHVRYLRGNGVLAFWWPKQ